jgi:hypothetical protein
LRCTISFSRLQLFSDATRPALLALALVASTACAAPRPHLGPEAVVAEAAPPAVSDAAPTSAPDEDDPSKKSLTEVNKELTNPVSSLWSITIQQNNNLVTTGPGGPTLYSPNLFFQPVVPVALTDNWNLITRPVIPFFVSQQHPVPGKGFVEPTAGIGDIILAQLLSPSPKLAGNWLLGLGPTWIFPAASSFWTGQGKWQVGPGALVGYLSDKWILGALAQNWTSFGGSGPQSTNGMNLQPFASYFLPDGWSVGYSGNILANWKATGGNAWTVPVGVSVAKVVKLGPLPVRFALGGQYMVVNPRDFGQKWNIQLIIAPVMPKLVRGNLLDPASLEFGLPKRPPAP